MPTSQEILYLTLDSTSWHWTETVMQHNYICSTYSYFWGENICVKRRPSRRSSKHTPSPQRVHQFSCLLLTIINCDSQNSLLPLAFLSLHPSILLNLYTHFLSIYLPLSLRCLVLLQLCHVNGWHWRDYCISNSLFVDSGESLSQWLN